ncbi:MAG: lysylphosphatidylglycerol synthase transmembrane domain-containing protein [Kofleriaceae bacterium]
MTTSPTPSDAPEPGRERNLGSHLFNLAMMVVGGVALTWMIRTMGWDEVTDAVKNVGWWFAVILALDLAALCCDAAALHAFMRPEARMVSYLRVLGAQSSARAINVLTPTGALGEATKITMLVAHAPRDRVLSSVLLQNLSQFYMTVIIMIIGTPILFLLVDVPHGVKMMVIAGFAVLIPLFIALAVVIKRGALATVLATLRRTRIISAERTERWKIRVVEVDKHIRELQQNRSFGTWKGLLWVLLSKGITWTSTMVLLANVGVDVTPALVIGMMSVGILIQWIAQIVPMGLGLADGGNYALFDFVGAEGSFGVVLTMLNRARSVAVAMLGLAAMAVIQVVNRLASARIHRRLHALRDRAAAATEPSV